MEDAYTDEACLADDSLQGSDLERVAAQLNGTQLPSDSVRPSHLDMSTRLCQTSRGWHCAGGNSETGCAHVGVCSSGHTIWWMFIE